MIAAVLVAALAVPAAAATYADAKAAYDAGNFIAATAEFEALVSAHPGEATLHYDLGNALLKAGKRGRASASYQRAFDLDPRDADNRHNLDFVLKLSGEELSPPGIPAPAFAAFTLLSARELAGLHWLAAWITLFFAGLALLGRTLSLGIWKEQSLALWLGRRNFSNCLIISATAWLFLFLWWAGLCAVFPPERGVIVAERAELRNGPGNQFTVGYTAPEGRRVRVLSESGVWLEVGLLKEGVKGWTSASSVENLAPRRSD